MESFIERLLKCPEEGFNNVHSDHMSTETALLGYHLGEWHLAQGDGFELQTLVQCLQRLKASKRWRTRTKNYEKMKKAYP